MHLATWAAIATVAAGSASVLSLVFVGFQLRSLAKQTLEQARQAAATTEAIHNSTYVEVAKAQFDQNRFLAEHPDLRVYLYGVAEGDGPQEELHKAQAAAEMFVDFVDLVVMQRDYLPHDMDKLWEKYVTDIMRTSGPVRDFWRSNRHWFDAEVRSFLDRALKRAVATASTDATALNAADQNKTP